MAHSNNGASSKFDNDGVNILELQSLPEESDYKKAVDAIPSLNIEMSQSMSVNFANPSSVKHFNHVLHAWLESYHSRVMRLRLMYVNALHYFDKYDLHKHTMKPEKWGAYYPGLTVEQVGACKVFFQPYYQSAITTFASIRESGIAIAAILGGLGTNSKIFKPDGRFNGTNALQGMIDSKYQVVKDFCSWIKDDSLMDDLLVQRSEHLHRLDPLSIPSVNPFHKNPESHKYRTSSKCMQDLELMSEGLKGLNAQIEKLWNDPDLEGAKRSKFAIPRDRSVAF